MTGTDTTSTAHTISPLLGDGDGRYRVHVVGNSGSGKSTTAIALAKLLGDPYIAMDQLLFNPGWVQSSREEFQARLRAALDGDDRGWVADGNYAGMGGDIAQEMATDVIWLDPPLYIYFPRLIWRTFLRLFRVEPPCSPGCYENPTETFFSRNSILLWCLSDHPVVHQRNQARMRLIGIEEGTDLARRRMRRFGGWGDDVKRWLGEVASMLRNKRE